MTLEAIALIYLITRKSFIVLVALIAQQVQTQPQRLIVCSAMQESIVKKGLLLKRHAPQMLTALLDPLYTKTVI